MNHKNVVDEASVPWDSVAKGEHFALRRRRLGKAAGAAMLGCSLTEVEPGKTAWPFHYHQANEEAIYVLSGHATLRLGEERIPLEQGDYVALPADAELPHQVTNTGAKTLRYLALSTMVEPDVVYYPDSKKVRTPLGTFKEDAAVDEWDGEPVGDPAAKLEEQIDDQLDEIREKLARDPGAPRKKTFRERVEDKVEELKRSVSERLSGDDEDEALERQIDDEIEQLKKKLDLAPKK